MAGLYQQPTSCASVYGFGDIELQVMFVAPCDEALCPSLDGVDALNRKAKMTSLVFPVSKQEVSKK